MRAANSRVENERVDTVSGLADSQVDTKYIKLAGWIHPLGWATQLRLIGYLDDRRKAKEAGGIC